MIKDLIQKAGGGEGDFKKMSEEEELRQNLKMSKYISEMDAELTDRFKALKILMDDCHDLDEEEQMEYRKLELEFEEKYKVIYAMREKLVNGKNDETY